MYLPSPWCLLSAQWGCFTTIFRYEDDDRPDRTNIDDCIRIHVTDCVDITEDSGFGAHLAWARTFFRGGGLVLMNTPGSGYRWCWRSDIAGRNLQQLANHGLTFTAGRTTNVAVYSQLDVAYIATDELVAWALVVRTILQRLCLNYQFCYVGKIHI